MSSMDDGANGYEGDAGRRRYGGRSNVIRAAAGESGKVWRRGTVSEERERQWANLLYDRPEERNENDMSQWLLSVLQVSDPASQVPSMSSSNDANGSSGATNSNNGTTSTSNGDSGSGNGDSGSGNGDSGSGASEEPRAESSSSSPGSEEAVMKAGEKRKDSAEIEDEHETITKKRRRDESPEQQV